MRVTCRSLPKTCFLAPIGCSSSLVNWKAHDTAVMPAHGRPSRTKGLQLDLPPLVGGPVAGVVHLDRLVGQRETRDRLALLRDAFHEILNLLQIAARPFLLEADILP